MTVTTGGRDSRSSSLSASASASRSMLNDPKSSRSSSSGDTSWMSYPSSVPSSWKVSSSSDWVAVAISPRWIRTVTSAAGLASMRSAKSLSDEPRRIRMTVLPSPCGTLEPAIDGGAWASNS